MTGKEYEEVYRGGSGEDGIEMRQEGRGLLMCVMLGRRTHMTGLGERERERERERGGAGHGERP